MQKSTYKNTLCRFVSAIIAAVFIITTLFSLKTYSKTTATIKSKTASITTSKAIKKQPKINYPIKNMTVTGFYALGSWYSLFSKNYPYTSKAHTNQLSTLAFAWYSVDEKGHLLTYNSYTGWQKPDGYKSLLNEVKKDKLKTEMVVSTAAGTNEAKVLNSSSSWNASVANIVYEARQYDGVNLDFENITSSYKNNFTSYVRLLSSGLKKANLKLTLSLQPPNSTYKGYDYKELGKLADKVIIMAHDYWKLPHVFPKPEPDNKVIEAIDISKKYIPQSKLILGISIASETAKSIMDKINLAEQYNLSGISLWYLGKMNDDMWLSVKNTIIAKKY